MGDLQIVVFSLNKELCGADTAQVHEIIKYQEITKVPKMPKFIDGMVNMRGKVVPVINLNSRFELGETEITKKTKIIFTKVNESSVGFIVNDVFEILKLAEKDIEATPDLIVKAGNAYLKNVGKKDGQLIYILDLNSILNEKEIKELK